MPRSCPIGSALGPNALSLQRKALHVVFDSTAATATVLWVGWPCSADVISPWQLVFVATPTRIVPRISLLHEQSCSVQVQERLGDPRAVHEETQTTTFAGSTHNSSRLRPALEMGHCKLACRTAPR